MTHRYLIVVEGDGSTITVPKVVRVDAEAIALPARGYPMVRVWVSRSASRLLADIGNL